PSDKILFMNGSYVINKGDKLAQLVIVPIWTPEYKEIVLSKIMERESKEREMARQRRKEAELRRKKPHLFNVPQVHPRGRYACYLMENDIFVKVKK
ncbi:SA1788 family PVL leukocidin-associated protein, partial [Staphylococcus aureus]|uniref:SA1788 family PVL leukocidin-associated protein n=1 Tax=Staphylococcus aureus TaxID=1280 RepID=UPI000452D5F9